MTHQQSISCPCCGDPMDPSCVVCWECYRLSNRLQAGTWPDGNGSSFELTTADVERYDGLRAERIGGVR